MIGGVFAGLFLVGGLQSGTKPRPEGLAGPAPAPLSSPSTTTSAYPSFRTPGHGFTSSPLKPTLSGFEFYSATVHVPSIALRDRPDSGAPVRVTLGEHNENG